jgi:hypothetical protein
MDDVTVPDAVATEEAPVSEECGSACEAVATEPVAEAVTEPAAEEAPPADAVAPAEAELAGAT